MSPDRSRDPYVTQHDFDWQKSYLIGKFILGILVIGIGGKVTRDSSVRLISFNNALDQYKTAAISRSLNSCELNIARDLFEKITAAQRNAAFGIFGVSAGSALISTTWPNNKTVEKRKPHRKDPRGQNRHF